MIQYYNGYKVLKLFLESPLKGFSLREISRTIKLGLPSVTNYIQQLQQDNLIYSHKEGISSLWYANREDHFFKQYKKFQNIMELEKSELLPYLEEEYHFPTIILFGSKSLGEDVEISDIDLCIITERKEQPNLEKYEKKIKSPIQIITYNQKDFTKLKEKNNELLNNIINGTTLRGMIKT